MADMVISIRKEYCKQLFTGKKRYEFRKIFPKHRVDTMFVYESRGCGKIIGELKVSEVLENTPELIWEQTKEWAAIDRDAFFKYFNGREKAVAFVISSYLKYEHCVSLSQFGMSRAPENYYWTKF